MGGTVNMGGKVLYTVIHLYNSCTQYSTVGCLEVSGDDKIGLELSDEEEIKGTGITGIFVRCAEVEAEVEVWCSEVGQKLNCDGIFWNKVKMNQNKIMA